MKIEKDLLGKRLRIRNYERTDLVFLTNMWFDEENGKYLSDPTREYVDEAYQKALDTLDESPYGYYLVIELADTRTPIGSACMFPDESKRIYDIGYCIHQSHQKQGYGSEAVSLILDFLKEHGAQKVTAEVATENIPSNRLLCKLGFTVEKETEFKKYNMNIRFNSSVYARVL